MMADTLLAALGRAQGGPQERLDWLLLGLGRSRGVGRHKQGLVKGSRIRMHPSCTLRSLSQRLLPGPIPVSARWPPTGRHYFSAALSRPSGDVFGVSNSTALERRRLQARTKASAGSVPSFRFTRSTAVLPASIAAAVEHCGNVLGVTEELFSSASGPRPRHTQSV